jgi:hypothetical protein
MAIEPTNNKRVTKDYYPLPDQIPAVVGPFGQSLKRFSPSGTNCVSLIRAHTPSPQTAAEARMDPSLMNLQSSLPPNACTVTQAPVPAAGLNLMQ